MSRQSGRLRPRLIAIYRALLFLYPPSFRLRFQEQMVEDTRELLRGEDPHWDSSLRVLLRLSKDLLRSVPREWLLVLREHRSVRAPDSATPSRCSEPVLQETAAAARRLLRHPSFSLGLIVLLSIVLGAATAVSAVIGSYLLRPLPYPEADRIVAVRPVVPVSAAEAADLFEVAGTWDLDAFTLLGEESSELAYGAWVSDGYFELFGMRAALGRLFGANETGPGGTAVAVISHELWQRRWGGDPGVIGRTVRAFTSDRPEDAELFTVVGVLPSDIWHHNRYVEFLAPLRTENPVYIGRLRAGVPPEDAARALEARARPRMESVPADFRVRLVSLQAEYTAELRPLLSVGAAVVALLLLIAWANAAVLLLIRSQTQERELWVRRALGASGRRLATQLALEALLLAGCAGTIGAIMAGLLLDRLGGALQTSLGRPVPGGAEALSLNAHALAAATATTVFTALVLALTPWLGAALRARGSEGAARSARGATAGRGHTRARDVLVTAELALSIVLLVGGILAVRSARHLAVQELGFDPDGVYVANVQLRARSYPESAHRAAFYDELAAAVRELPMVEAAAVSVLAPFRWGYAPQPAEAEGNVVPRPRVEATRLVVGPQWFETMRVRALSGRTFTTEDGPEASPVAVVSEGLARRLWPDGQPPGRRFRFLPTGSEQGVEPGHWITVVGVVSEIRGSIADDGTPAVYLPIAQAGERTVTLAARMRGALPDPLPELRRAVGGVDPTVALYAPGWLSESVTSARRASRFLAGFLAGFSSLAVVLAVLGLYAVLAFAATQRRRDVAILIALGARRRTVIGHFLAGGMALAGAGLLLGMAGAVLLGKALASQLHGVSHTDVASYAAAAFLLLVVAAAAVWVPSQRAASVDPMEVLRED